jgi:hypothetical protein
LHKGRSDSQLIAWHYLSAALRQWSSRTLLGDLLAEGTMLPSVAASGLIGFEFLLAVGVSHRQID